MKGQRASSSLITETWGNPLGETKEHFVYH